MNRAGVLAIVALGAACAEQKPDDPPPPPLEIVTATLPDVDLGAPYEQKLAARGGEAPYAFAVASGALPEGIELKPATGQLTGLAGAPGRHDFTIEVTDAGKRRATRALSIYVVPEPLEIVTSRLSNGQQGIAYSEALVARGGVPPIAWSISGGVIPAGLSLGAGDGALAGTPTEFGGFDFTVRVTDAEDRTADRTLMLALVSLDPMIETSTIPKARLDQPYEVRFTATGAIPPYTWSIDAGALPDGLALAPDGTLSGTPAESGDFSFTVRATDLASRSDAAGFVLRVIPPLVLTTTSLPQVIRGRPVSFQLEAAGGVPPYDWALRGGRLPQGLTFSQEGLLSGSTRETGSSDLTIRVRDAEGAQKSALFTLSVSDRFTYHVEPAVAFPPVCTATNTSYASAAIDVTDSMQVDELDVAIDVRYTDLDTDRYDGDLKIELHAPDGRFAVLCGRNAGVRERGGVNTGCAQAQLQASYDDLTAPDQDLAVFRGMNPRGTWRLVAIVANPSGGRTGCRQDGRIESVELRIRDDRETGSYVVVRGFARNNLITEPWVRLSGGGLPESELFLSATIYSVGPNGYREGGEGDDVADPIPMTWSFAGSAQVATVTPDGHVAGGRRTGSGQLTASGGGLPDWTATLKVVPPDWNTAARQH